MRATIFWDFENCHVPTNVKLSTVYSMLKNLCTEQQLTLGKIYAIGNIQKINSETLVEMEDSNIILKSVSSGKKEAADQFIYVEVVQDVIDFKPPHTMIFITSDGGFTKLLNTLDSNNYSTILIHQSIASKALIESANKTFSWRELLNVDKTVFKKTQDTLCWHNSKPCSFKDCKFKHTKIDIITTFQQTPQQALQQVSQQVSQQVPQKRYHLFTWNQKSAHVKICGSWNNWTEIVLPKFSSDIFQKYIYVPCGEHHYYFIVDDEHVIIDTELASSDGKSNIISIE